MPTNNTLTDSKCRAFKPSTAPKKHSDGGGLFLYITPQGSKLWRCAYRLEGKQQTASFGSYPEITLGEARRQRDGLKAKLRTGEPVKEVKQKVSLTLTEAHDTYWGGRKDLSISYLSKERGAYERHVKPLLGARMMKDITRIDVLTMLNVMDAAGLHVFVRKVRMWLAQLWDWAIEQGEATENPARSIKPDRAFGKRTVEHFAALTLPEVPAFFERLAFEAELQSVLACKFLALTWVRTGEMRMMEFTEVDGDLWRIPAGKMKRRREHVVPLSAAAVAIIEKLRARSRGSKYVFPNDRRLDRPMSENSVLFLIARAGYKGRMTGHGFRTMGSTWANEHGYSADAIERQLAHAPDDKVRAVYNRADYLTERRKMLHDWSMWLPYEGQHAPESQASTTATGC